MCEGRAIPNVKAESYSKILSKTSMETEPWSPMECFEVGENLIGGE